MARSQSILSKERRGEEQDMSSQASPFLLCGREEKRRRHGAPWSWFIEERRRTGHSTLSSVFFSGREQTPGHSGQRAQFLEERRGQDGT
jgi:hypothetical protein